MGEAGGETAGVEDLKRGGVNRESPISLWDRILLGAMSAVAGAVLGLAVAFVVFLLIGSFHGTLVGVSAIYFFAIGYLKGSHAGHFAGEAIWAVVALAMASETSETPKGASMGAGPSILLWGGYALCLVLGVMWL